MERDEYAGKATDPRVPIHGGYSEESAVKEAESVYRLRRAQQQAREQQATAYTPPPQRGVTLDNVEHVFTYQNADAQQLEQYALVREAMIGAAKAILRFVPDCADRSAALRKLREARMDANAAIALRGLI